MGRSSGATRRKKTTGRRRGRGEPAWARLPDDELLQLRFCDLDLAIEGTILEERIDRLYAELSARRLRFRPHCWISDEWFSPDGVPGIAIPFYLAHPRLMQLERRFMLEVEGGTEDWCMRILRHEAGHAVDVAFGLYRRRAWQRYFGKRSLPYPDYYEPKPYSKSYVLHLNLWYAQSHPAEDFAETFAVWLRPRSRWRQTYKGWPALAKLEYVDGLMRELVDRPPKVRSRATVDPVRSNRGTLAEHYEDKRSRYKVESDQFYDQPLRRLFSDSPEFADRPTAASFLRRIRGELRQVVANWTGQHQYVIDQVLLEMIDRCRRMNLRLDRSPRRAKRDALVMLAVQTMNYLNSGHHRLAL
jgi:hypothetical protein